MSGDRRHSVKEEEAMDVLTELENQVDELLRERNDDRRGFRKLEERER